ncbi:2-amino-4-hydroxy-6-hydroxymethyldihydropteridine diphosphokinase [Chitinispirillales bacterium ANBcel5]|uniref:2-amino-4-hydroxy-6- hydroxymethyldihydropteridine diphosphokinase n=1 Tax=Cellulosispirillum alkaliphilum TaxID=3039283 RepID=UPI002A576CB0|nr:2-amino-4-hydroxy-6-hydroxymethyldihydropteridine diphosphokinase [Chitinispirillales bacterium ANBcel5]
MATEIVLSIGTNSGNRIENIIAMQDALFSLLGEPFRCSTLMETEPLEVGKGQLNYYNQIVYATYNGTPQELLFACEGIEITMGRSYKGLKLARTADIDILFFGDTVVWTKGLQIPHQGILRRRFCLEGLYEMCPQWVYPGRAETVEQLYLKMNSEVKQQSIQFYS